MLVAVVKVQPRNSKFHRTFTPLTNLHHLYTFFTYSNQVGPGQKPRRIMLQTSKKMLKRNAPKCTVPLHSALN